MSGPANLSFKFSKTIRKNLDVVRNSTDSSKTAKEIIQNVEEEEESELQITSGPVLISGFDAKGFKEVAAAVVKKEKELIIPALKNTLQLHPVDGNDEDSAAKRALLEDAQRLLDTASEKIEDLSSIPVQLQKEEKVDLSKISTDDPDYNSVSVDVFGKALLRGMGWKEGEAIGRSGKKAAAPIVTAPRPKGLGLGAEIKPPPGPSASTSASGQRNGDAEDALALKIGAYVKRLDAKTDKDRYGKVISWDEDNARIVVQLAIGRATVHLSQHVVRVVTYKEYEKAGKCINQTSYEEFKALDPMVNGPRANGSERAASSGNRKRSRSPDRERERRRPRSSSIDSSESSASSPRRERDSRKNRRHHNHDKDKRSKKDRKRSRSASPSRKHQEKKKKHKKHRETPEKRR